MTAIGAPRTLIVVALYERGVSPASRMMSLAARARAHPTRSVESEITPRDGRCCVRPRGHSSGHGLESLLDDGHPLGGVEETPAIRALGLLREILEGTDHALRLADLLLELLRLGL